MTASTITSLTTAVNVTTVTSIVVTATADDGNGGFLRAIKVYGDQGTGANPVFTLILSADTSTKIAVHTGDLTF